MKHSKLGKGWQYIEGDENVLSLLCIVMNHMGFEVIWWYQYNYN